jgi:hypothetical protein
MVGYRESGALFEAILAEAPDKPISTCSIKYPAHASSISRAQGGVDGVYSSRQLYVESIVHEAYSSEKRSLGARHETTCKGYEPCGLELRVNIRQAFCVVP